MRLWFKPRCKRVAVNVFVTLRGPVIKSPAVQGEAHSGLTISRTNSSLCCDLYQDYLVENEEGE